MNLEYQSDNLSLIVLNENHAIEVLDFYKRNAAIFNQYETEKPANFYTLDFISNLLHAEYNNFISGRYARFFLIDRNHPGELIGTISFSDIKGGSLNSCCIGYKIDQKFQRQGYARRMLTMALKILITERHMHRIEAYISPDNVASIHLVETLGFISEGIAYSYVKLNGTWRDHYRYVYINT